MKNPRYAIVCEIRVVNLIKAGWYKNEIANEFGASPVTIDKIAKKYELNFNKYLVNICESKEARIVYDFSSGVLGVEKLLSKYNIGRDLLKRIFIRNNLEYPKVEMEEKYANILDEMKYKYEETDWDAKYIGKHYNVQKKTVLELAKRFGWVRKVWKRKHFRDIWKRDEGEQAGSDKYQDYLKLHDGMSRGEKNPMYGRPSPKGSGNGWKGRFNGHYFRSLRELVFLLQNYEKGIDPKSAERKIYSIEYEWMGSKRTYRPDFLIGDTLYEIKPKRLISSPNITAKTKAAIEFAKDNNLNYIITDVKIDSDLILKYISNKMVIFDRDYLERFLSYVTKQ